jgi:hemerythrin-like domain-containing protein
MTEAHIEEIPAALMAEPLNWLFAEHYRHRQLCRLLEVLAAAAVFEPEPIRRALDFIGKEMALHVVDEEEDLFPMLRRRCEPEDDLESVLGVLSAEHRSDITAAGAVREKLQACLDERKAPGLDFATRKALTDFARHQRRHIALENAVVLPIARLRLDAADLRTLGRRLAARRGVVIEDRAP